eukprot:360908-Chlamydomonas_euryale.AAC.19
MLRCSMQAYGKRTGDQGCRLREAARALSNTLLIADNVPLRRMLFRVSRGRSTASAATRSLTLVSRPFPVETRLGDWALVCVCDGGECLRNSPCAGLLTWRRGAFSAA